ncbi:CU044_5270 family protein [Nonomuraea sp. NPDC046802]|uniref:CU044_5270 family protein n=1 Tax=Nonomuraea sp. NPDC046802 TaxID=3154919 RepID=UPI0033EA8E11
MTGEHADLEALRRAWPEPGSPSPDARAAARAALLRRTAPRPVRRLRRRAVTVGVLAALLTAVGLVVDPAGVVAPRVPGLVPPAAHALLRRAADAAQTRSFTAPRPDQWVYLETRQSGLPDAASGEVQTPSTPLETRVGRSWTRADGKEVVLFEDGKLVRSPTGGSMPPIDYATVSTLPTDPDALLTWMYANLGPSTGTDEEQQVTACRLLGSLIAQNLVPPAQEAAVYRAMAKIPVVTVNPGASDVEGRPAVGVACVEDGWVSHELLLDRSTSTYLGERTVAVADHTFPAKDGRTISNRGKPATIKKGTVISLAARLAIGVTDRPGVRP